MKSASALFRVIAILCVAVAGIYAAVKLFIAPSCCVDGISPLIVAEPQSGAKSTTGILFIGNSYTFHHNLPDMVAKIAASDTENDTRYEIQSVTKAGTNLKELWEAGEALSLIKSRNWDYVVLQEQSFWAMFPESIRTTTHFAKAFHEYIKASGARTVIFVTWARKPGSKWYTDGKTGFLRNPEFMQKQFNEYSARLGESIGAAVIGVGDYWAYSHAAYPDIVLYDNDGTHPAPTGTYLSALLFYRFFSGHAPVRVTFVPEGVDENQATTLRSLVSQ